MKFRPSAVSLAAGLIVSSRLFAAQFLVVNKLPDGGFQLLEAESLTVNASEKVRVFPSDATGGSFDPKQASRLPQERLAGFRVIRNDAAGMKALSEAEAAWHILVPEGRGAKERTSATPLQLWQDASIAIKKDKAQKTLEGVLFNTLYAVLPGATPSQSAADLASHSSWLASPNDSLSLIVAIVKTYPDSPAAKKIRLDTTDAMTAYSREWLRGGVPRSVLERWLALAHTAETAFRDDQRLMQLSSDAHRQEASLARKAAILNALDAGGRADEFLERYLAFEPFQHFADSLAASRAANYRLSGKMHYQAGSKLLAKKEYAEALKEFRLASRRDPSMKEAVQALDETRLEVARQSAAAAAERLKGLDLRSPQQVQLQRHVLMAEQYLKDAKLTESRKELETAEAIDDGAAGVVMIRARLLAAQGELGEALATMDRYAGSAANDREFADGEKYRATLSYELQREKSRLVTLLTEQYDSGKFASALQTAAAGLKLDAEEPAFLYHAGVDACILRRCEQGGPPLKRFLDITDGLGGDVNKRIAALRLLQPKPAAPPRLSADAGPKLAWLSGTPLASDTLYDPVSLAFQPKVSEVKASKKLTVSYQWKGASLQDVRARYEDNQDAGHDKVDFYFDYSADASRVVRVRPSSAGENLAESPVTIRVPENGTAATNGKPQSYTVDPDVRRDFSQGYLTLLNSPAIDVGLALELTGKRAAAGFSGNSYFHPFAWDGLHFFEFEYDAEGRVRYAWEIGGRGHGGRLDFEWDGARLLSVRQHANKDGGEITYLRTLNYSGNRLAGESVQYQDKTAKIEYRYDKRGVLIEADCGEDQALDGRSRKAIFLQ